MKNGIQNREVKGVVKGYDWVRRVWVMCPNPTHNREIWEGKWEWLIPYKEKKFCNDWEEKWGVKPGISDRG